ncbi:MAG TPA: alcohol dehydrogenase catalytic domain-containing protein, partial [Steroidobacteraceae bacterium]
MSSGPLRAADAAALPAEMLIAEAPRPGGPQALIVGRRPVPQPAAGELLIEVDAAGLNRADVLQREGRYPPPPGAPDYPGLEVAGRVRACAADVREFSAGERV